MPLIQEIAHKKQRMGPIELLISKWSSFTKKFIREHPDILFTRADKGNVTVAMNKKDYITKMEELPSDKNTYIINKKDPTKQITGELRTLLKRWSNNKYIDPTIKKKIYTSDGILPRACGLPKIHFKIQRRKSFADYCFIN